jgi:flagellar FliJ protein
MKKFRYNLENLLQVKLKLEDQAKIAYGAARLRLTKEEEKLAELQRKKASYEEEQRELRKARLDLVRIKKSAEAIEIMEQKVKLQAAAVRNATQRLEVARIRLNDAMVERKTQEKLKEKAWEEYLLEFDAEERKEVDELNSFQYSNPAHSEEDR